MQVSQESVAELESVVAQYEQTNESISLEAMSDSSCECTGSCGHSCSGSCEGGCDSSCYSTCSGSGN